MPSRRDFCLDNVVYLTQDEQMPEEEKDGDTEYIRLDIKEYVDRPNRTHAYAFFTTILPGNIMETLTQTLIENKIEF